MNEPNAKRKIVCVLYDDPVDGYPPKYARDGIPTLTAYPDGQALPSPSTIDFSPGDLYSEGDATGGSDEAAQFKTGD